METGPQRIRRICSKTETILQVALFVPNNTTKNQFFAYRKGEAKLSGRVFGTSVSEDGEFKANWGRSVRADLKRKEKLLKTRSKMR